MNPTSEFDGEENKRRLERRLSWRYFPVSTTACALLRSTRQIWRLAREDPRTVPPWRNPKGVPTIGGSCSEARPCFQR